MLDGDEEKKFFKSINLKYRKNGTLKESPTQQNRK